MLREVHHPKEHIPVPSRGVMDYALSIEPSVLEGTGYLLHYMMTAAMVADKMAEAYEEATGETLDRRRMVDMLVTQHAIKILAGLAGSGQAAEELNVLFQEGGLPADAQYPDLPGAHRFDDMDFALLSGKRAGIDPVVLGMLNRYRKRHAGKRLLAEEGMEIFEQDNAWALARLNYHARHEDGTRDWAVTIKELAAWMTDRGMVTTLANRMGKIEEMHVEGTGDVDEPHRGGGVKIINALEMQGLKQMGQLALDEFCGIIGIRPENFLRWLKQELKGAAPDSFAQKIWEDETFPSESYFYLQGEKYRAMLYLFEILRRANTGATHLETPEGRIELERDNIRANLENLLRNL